MKDFLKNTPLAKFLLIALGAYIAWIILYEGVFESLGWKIKLDFWVSQVLSDTSAVLLDIFGFDPTQRTEGDFVVIGLPDPSGFGVHIGPDCNGVSLFALFLVYVLAFPGPSKKKLWFIPLGILSIHLLNTIRIASLAYIARYYPAYLDLNHTYTFQILVYAHVFFLWYVWTNKMSGLTHDKNTTDEI